MLLKRATLEGIRDGRITLAFRRWKRPTVKAGGRLRTAIGELEIRAVDRVRIADLTARAARDAGFESVAALKEELRGREGDLYRVRVAWSGEDPRIALRSKATLDAAERAELDRRLAGMDARSQDGPWTRAYLACIEANPGQRAPDLAAGFGLETKPFKARVRRLKELGLTESLAVGYRISPRGRAWLRGVRR